MARILCKNGRIFDGNDFFFGDIAVDGTQITAIAPRIDEQADFVFDAAGYTVLPGLVDSHIHIRGISSDAFGLCADAITLPFGVTAAVDASGCQGDRAFLDALSVKNLTFLVTDIRDNCATFAAADKMAPLYGDKAIGLKVFFDKKMGQARDITPLKQAAEYADKHGLQVMVHSSNSPVPMKELLDALRPGDILTHAYHGGEHNVSEDNFESLLCAKQRGVIIDAGLAGYVHMDFAVFAAAIKRGVLPHTISTDITRTSAYKRGGRYGFPMCMSIARHLGMEEADIFRAVTSTPARVFGKAGKWGTLQVGGTADIAVLSYENEGFDLTDFQGNRIAADKGYRNKLTVLNGDIVYRD